MINRKKLVNRHNPHLTTFAPYSPLSIGNGEFVFTTDITGLQSFQDLYTNAMPLCTMANWGWHSTPFSDTVSSISKEEVGTKMYDTYGRQVPYYTNRSNTEKYNWVRQNPHKYHLGRIGFAFFDQNNNRLSHSAITDINQELDIYTGILHSSYSINDNYCITKTAVCAYSDTIAVSSKSNLIPTGQMVVEVEFPYPTHEITGALWDKDNLHTSTLLQTPQGYMIERTIDDVSLNIIICGANISVEQVQAHKFIIKNATENMDFTVSFNTMRQAESPFDTSRKKWQEFWENGGIISLEKATDPRAIELERRIVLSQYLTALQCGGSLPPAETGLTCNSWYGKFHLEMHYWHAAHFATFGRPEYLEKSLQWYFDISQNAKKATEEQGYEGIRWPKMVDPSGQDSPSPIGPLLIWQQPHVLFYCEWMYRANKTQSTLEKYRPLVEETANFMASFAHFDGVKYNLGSPVIPAQENHAAETCINPTYELSYWKYGLKVAIQWYKDMNLQPPKAWVHVSENLASPAIENGVYLAHENCPDTFENFNRDHPSMLMAYGVVGDDSIDKEVMNATLNRVLSDWNFPGMWGWDFGVMAMTATRLGRPDIAIEVLLKETAKNIYVTNGHNRQVSRNDLPLYLPGNGSLLLAISMMAAGFEGCTIKTPGFNVPGWQVEFEGILPYSAEC